MSYQEKRSLVSLFSTIIIFAAYCFYVFGQNAEIDRSQDFSFWGAFILLMIPVQVVFKVIIHVIFVVINFVATQEEDPSLTDERDQLIDLKSTRNFYHVFMAGFLLSMGALVLDKSPEVMFSVIVGSFLAAGIVADLSQFYFYRQGV